jgi:hypothetical protein
MANSSNPSFVRLAPRASRGVLADIGGSGWSISGRDVLPYPDKAEEPEAARFVRQNIRRGILEEASRGEYEEVHPEVDEEEVPRVIMMKEPPHQEHLVREKHLAKGKAITKTRDTQTRRLEGDLPDEEDDEPDQGELTSEALGNPDEMNKSQLKDWAGQLGLDDSGTVAQLRSRIKEELAADEDDDSEDDEDGDDE